MVHDISIRAAVHFIVIGCVSAGFAFGCEWSSRDATPNPDSGGSTATTPGADSGGVGRSDSGTTFRDSSGNSSSDTGTEDTSQMDSSAPDADRSDTDRADGGGGSGGNLSSVRHVRRFDRGIGNDVAVDDNGNAYVVGRHESPTGPPNKSISWEHPTYNSFIAKYDSSGKLQWSHRLGPTSGQWNNDEALGVTISAGGNIYVVGATTVALGNQTLSGETDGYLARYTPSGTRKWIRFIGTPDHDWATDVTTTGVGTVRIHVVGRTEGNLGGQTNKSNGGDGFVTTFGVAGNHNSVVLTGANGGAVTPTGVTSTQGRIFVTGSVNEFATLAGKKPQNRTAGFLARYARLPVRRKWVKVFGGGKLGDDTLVHDIQAEYHLDSAPSGKKSLVFLAGHTNNFSQNDGGDALLMAYDTSGKRRWVDFAQSTDMYGFGGLDTDDAGTVYLSSDSSPATLARYDTRGQLKATQKLTGSRYLESQADAGLGIAHGAADGLFVTGTDRGPGTYERHSFLAILR